MRFKIPFTFSSNELLRRRIKPFLGLIKIKKKTFRNLELNLKNADTGFTKEEYVAIAVRSFVVFFLIFSTLLSSILFVFDIEKFYFFGTGLGVIMALFIFANQMTYPRIFSFKKTRNIEKNLLPALQDMLVQLSSGVPMFQIIANISISDYGELSLEFKKAIREISSGRPQVEVLDEMAERNISVFFRRAVWQISNGFRAGSDMSIIIKDSMDNLMKEQTIQIQTYGSKLNPLIMFYMLIGVIVPSLGLTFLTIIASMMGLSGSTLKFMYIGIMALVTIMQIMFLGMIRTRRPSLL